MRPAKARRSEPDEWGCAKRRSPIRTQSLRGSPHNLYAPVATFPLLSPFYLIAV